MYLPEDVACIVEECLFTRYPFTLENCVFEGDHDGMAYFTMTHRGHYEWVFYPGLLKRLIRYAPNSATLVTLHHCFDVHTLSLQDLEACILFSALHGHCDKLQWLVNRYGYRGRMLDVAEFEIRYSLRERHEVVPLISIGFVEGGQDMVDTGVICTQSQQTREMCLMQCLTFLHEKKLEYLTGFSNRESF